MTWPQVVVLCLLLLGTISGGVGAIRNTKISSSAATWEVMYYLAFHVGYALVLHAGGFW